MNANDYSLLKPGLVAHFGNVIRVDVYAPRVGPARNTTTCSAARGCASSRCSEERFCEDL